MEQKAQTKDTKAIMKGITIQAIVLLFITLWAYTGIEKLLGYDAYLGAIRNQVFPLSWAEWIAPVVVLVELALALLLLAKPTRTVGLLLSTLLMTVFTTYIGLVWMGAFPRVPCSCAGLLQTMGWPAHLVFNMVFIFLGAGAVLLQGTRNKTIQENMLSNPMGKSH